jgi:hypothetical protein
VIASVRLARVDDIGRPSPKILSVITDSVTLARELLEAVLRRYPQWRSRNEMVSLRGSDNDIVRRTPAAGCAWRYRRTPPGQPDSPVDEAMQWFEAGDLGGHDERLGGDLHRKTVFGC